MGNHPILPNHRPLAIAHRAGNSIDLARRAIERGFDMIEADVWSLRNRLEIRHANSLGPFPIYWEKWYIESVGKPLLLPELVAALPPTAPLFLDFKGEQAEVGEQSIESIQRVQQGRQVIVCGRNWSQLDPIESLPNVHVFYSVGDVAELAQVWAKLARQQHPAISIHHELLTSDTMQRLNDLGTTVVAWTVNDSDIAARLFAIGVDGFTSDNFALLDRIVAYRENAFAEFPAPPPENR